MHMQWQSIWGKLGQLTIQNIFCDLWVFYLCFAITLSQGFSITHLNTSMRPSLDAQARELDPWQKTNAFIFQPTTKSKNTINSLFEGQLWDQFFCLVEERLKNDRDRLKSGKSGLEIKKMEQAFQALKNFQGQRNVWKGSPLFPVWIFQTEILSSKSLLCHQFQAFTAFLGKWHWCVKKG